MKSRLAVLFSIFLFTLGCSKDNNQKPNISISSYTSTVNPGEVFSAKLAYSQGSGSLSQDSLVTFRHWYNLNSLPPGVDILDTFYTFLPETPNTNTATINVSLRYEDLFVDLGDENDTVDFSFVLIDNNGKHSDTVKTGKVVLVK